MLRLGRMVARMHRYWLAKHTLYPVDAGQLRVNRNFWHGGRLLCPNNTNGAARRPIEVAEAADASIALATADEAH
jgi:hypothetical protein